MPVILFPRWYSFSALLISSFLAFVPSVTRDIGVACSENDARALAALFSPTAGLHVSLPDPISFSDRLSREQAYFLFERIFAVHRTFEFVPERELTVVPGRPGFIFKARWSFRDTRNDNPYLFRVFFNISPRPAPRARRPFARADGRSSRSRRNAYEERSPGGLLRGDRPGPSLSRIVARPSVVHRPGLRPEEPGGPETPRPGRPGRVRRGPRPVTAGSWSGFANGRVRRPLAPLRAAVGPGAPDDVEGAAYYGPDGRLAVWLGNAIDLGDHARSGDLTLFSAAGAPFLVRDKASVYLSSIEAAPDGGHLRPFQAPGLHPPDPVVLCQADPTS